MGTGIWHQATGAFCFSIRAKQLLRTRPVSTAMGRNSKKARLTPLLATSYSEMGVMFRSGDMGS